MAGCSIRAIWILTPSDTVAFSWTFPVVERRWRRSSAAAAAAGDASHAPPSLPSDPQLAAAFSDRRQREGSVRGYGIRVGSSTPASDSWLDDPLTRHLISLRIMPDEEEEKGEGGEDLLWPLVLHTSANYYILVLPLVAPSKVKEYQYLYQRNDCGGSEKERRSLSALVLSLPSITGAFMVAHAIGDVISGETSEPEVAAASSSVGGLLDTLTGSIGISVAQRPKPASVLSTSSSSPATLSGSDSLRTMVKPIDKDVLRAFINGSMPYGTPLDLNLSNIAAIRTTGFVSAEPPPADLRQPAWKPYLYKGRQKILFMIQETMSAALYDRDEIPDSFSISGQLNCRAELEGLPDVQLPLNGLKSAKAKILSFHQSAQHLDHGDDKQAIIFSPPLGNFVLIRYQISHTTTPPPIKGFYQLSMVSEDKGQFLFRLTLMEGYKAPYLMDFCTVTMPFPRRRIVSIDGTPSIGTVSMTEKFIEWKIVTSGRGLSGKTVDVTFPGTVRFQPRVVNKSLSVSLSKSILGHTAEEDSDEERESANNNVNVEDVLMEKMNRDLQAVDLEEPLCWQAFNYAKVSFKMTGGTFSGITIDPKSISIYPAVKAPVETSMQVTSGDYILWNTLARSPHAAVPKELS